MWLHLFNRLIKGALNFIIIIMMMMMMMIIIIITIKEYPQQAATKGTILLGGGGARRRGKTGKPGKVRVKRKGWVLLQLLYSPQ